LAGCGDNIPRSQLSAFTTCHTSFECATLTVPADWTEPNGETIQLLVVRAPARDPSRRLGILTFNFGGPGAATLAPVANNYPTNPVSSTQDLAAVFDWVLMDWRGVATTNPTLSCLTNTTASELATQTFAPAGDADWATLWQLVGDVQQGCSAHSANAPLLLREDTESTARDFDALRAALGEDQWSMWMVSYGTHLGAMYASLFPDHVRAMALDSPMPPTPTFDGVTADQNASFEAEIQRFFTWCATSTAASCPFQTADGLASSLAAKYEQLLDQLDAAPIVASGVSIDRAALNLVVTSQMYFPQVDWPALAQALSTLDSGDGVAVAQLFQSGAIDFNSNDNAFSAFQNVFLQDMPLPAYLTSQAGYQAWTESFATIEPHVGVQNAAASAFAVGWPTTSPPEHTIGPTTAPPLLITATRHDPATPYPGAGELVQALANGSYLVTYEGDGHANAQFSPCLGETTASFLLDPTTPPAVSDCPAIVPTLTSTPSSLPPAVVRPRRRR
jgi:pimeloyl-ACP methyl ester carboxylesterase